MKPFPRLPPHPQKKKSVFLVLSEDYLAVIHMMRLLPRYCQVVMPSPYKMPEPLGKGNGKGGMGEKNHFCAFIFPAALKETQDPLPLCLPRGQYCPWS